MMESSKVKLSVICPCFNEEEYIEQLLDFFITARPTEKEIFLIDGGSTDRTKEMIASYQERHDNIFLLHNPNKIVPFALNLAIPQCKAETIVRLDAHSKYKEDYFHQIMITFEAVKADIVGGPTRTAHNSTFQHAVAQAICTPFGVGNSKVHDLEFEGYTDSVTFGAWRKSMFEKTGMFDTTLKRNQDDEFHYRAKSKGMLIYQNPAITLYYYPRDNAKGLFTQYFEYGLYKPRVLKKVNSEIKLRHLVPTIFALYLLSMPLAVLYPWWLVPAVLYFALDLYYALKMDGGPLVLLAGFFVYPLIHLGYGIGFLQGLIDDPVERLKKSKLKG